MKKWQWALVSLVGVGMIVSQYLDFIASPPEAQMGNVVRIMYFHVASAVVAFTAFGVTALFGIIFLIRKKWLWDQIARGSAEIGLVYTTFVLISGSIWGDAVWNTWWTWDPTLTTTLILWFLYLAYPLLRASITDRERAAKVASVFGFIAVIDVPLIHQSVTWWRGIHPNVITAQGFNMPPSMVVALLFSFVVFLGLYAVLLWINTQLVRDRDTLNDLREQARSVLAKYDERIGS